jgi:hypothetical protein
MITQRAHAARRGRGDARPYRQNVGQRIRVERFERRAETRMIFELRETLLGRDHGHRCDLGPTACLGGKTFGALEWYTGF